MRSCNNKILPSEVNILSDRNRSRHSHTPVLSSNKELSSVFFSISLYPPLSSSIFLQPPHKTFNMSKTKEARRRLSSVNLGFVQLILRTLTSVLHPILYRNRNKNNNFTRLISIKTDTDILSVGGTYPWHLLLRSV